VGRGFSHDIRPAKSVRLLPLRFKMRNFAGCLLLAIFAISLASFAQSGAAQSGTAKGQTAAPSKSLAGTWAISTPRGIPWYNYALIEGEPPMTPWAVEKFKANKPSFGPDPHEDSNDSAYACLPNGMPRVYAAVQASMQIVELTGRTLMFFGRNLRQIYTDGRQHPSGQKPLWMGDAIGKWDGDTFVIDTVAISDVNWLDRMGHPHSDKLHLIERFRRTDDKTMEMNLTIDDPIAYTKTWDATPRTFRLRANARNGEAFCEDIFLNEAFGLRPVLPSME
jgi:hypothetical protein